MKEATCGWHPKTHEGLDLYSLQGKGIVFEWFDLYIVGYDTTRAKAVKVIRDISGICYEKLDLKDAVKIINTLPHLYKDCLSLYTVQELERRMTNAKLKVRIDGIEMITDAQAIKEGLL